MKMESTQASVHVVGARAGVPRATPRSPVGPLLSDRPAWLRYAVAVLLMSAMAGLRFAVLPVMGTQAPLLPFAFAVFAVAYLGGLGPALASTAVAAVTATLLFAELGNPAHASAWAGHVLLFTVLGALISLLVHRLQSAYAAQRQALARATAGEEQLRLITDAVPALIAYVDADHRYRFNNKRYQEWFAIEGEELLGEHVRDVLGETVYELIKPRMQTALAGRSVDFEADVPYPTGGSRYISAHYVPDRDSQGLVRGYFALIEDISQRKREEQLLADVRARLSLALRAGRAGAFDWDIRSNRSVWSDELLELHGLKSDEFDGTQAAWLPCVHPEDLSRVQAAVIYALETGEMSIEYRIRRSDNDEIRWLQGRGQVYYDDSHSPIRMLGISVDITERKRAEELLREADRQKDAFLAMLAHELRNPLTPIRTVAHLLANQQVDGNTLPRCAEMIQRQVAILARIVDDLLDVARIRTGRIEIKRELIELGVIIERAVDTLQPAFQSKRQVVSLIRPAWPAHVHGDPVRLEQVFVNLLTNASKFSPDEARIEVGMDTVDGTVLAVVRDPGVGIDPQVLPSIFDLFMQAEQTLDRSQGGLGIGLTLAKRIAELHGGSVEARSDGLGKGSEFIVRLPRAPASPAGLADVPAPERAYTSRRVLLVEDNPDAAESLRILVAQAGHEVVVKTDAFEALDALDTFAPEWIFTDIGLRGLDGYALARRIRRHANGQRARIYALTGYGRAEDRERAMQSGFDGHLTKPVDPAELLGLLEEVRRDGAAGPRQSADERSPH